MDSTQRAEHEAHKKTVLKQFEDKAVAKFTALIPNFTDNIDAALDALGDLAAVRGLSPCEKRIMANLIVLDACRVALSCFTPEAHALKERRITP